MANLLLGIELGGFDTDALHRVPLGGRLDVVEYALEGAAEGVGAVETITVSFIFYPLYRCDAADVNGSGTVANSGLKTVEALALAYQFFMPDCRLVPLRFAFFQKCSDAFFGVRAFQAGIQLRA